MNSINQSVVERVIKALVDATTDDPEKLQTLITVLANDGQSTGLGYIITDATRTIARKLSSRSLHG